MTEKEFLENAKVIQFPLSQRGYKDYVIEGKEIHKIPIVEKSMYVNFPLNNNHFIPSYHREYVLPLLAKLLNINYNEEDFEIVNRKSEEGFDLSYLRPKAYLSFSIRGLEKDIICDNIGFDCLITCDSATTEYHKQYRFPHECSIIVNHTIKNGRKLFISGDSQLIPDIPWLACFFEELWYFDNRGGKSFKSLFENVEFSDALLEINCNDITKYTKTNLK